MANNDDIAGQLNLIMAQLSRMSSRIDTMESVRETANSTTPEEAGTQGQPAPSPQVQMSTAGFFTPQVVSEIRRMIQAPTFVPDRAVEHEFSENEESLKSSNAALPVFSGTDYTDWYEQHRVFFIRTGLMRFISGEEAVPDSVTNPELNRQWHSKNFRCLQIMMRTVSLSVRQSLIGVRENAPELWRQLRSIYFRGDQATIHSLLQKFYSYTYRPGQSLEQYVFGLSRCEEELRERGAPQPESNLIGQLLNGLPEEHRILKYTLRQREGLTFMEATNQLIAESRLLDAERSGAQGSAARGVEKGRGKGKGKQNQPGQPAANPAGQGGSLVSAAPAQGQRSKQGSYQNLQGGQRGQVETRTCHHCGKPGHLIKKCPDRTRTPKPCYICKSTAHIAFNCPMSDRFAQFLKKEGVQGGGFTAAGQSEPGGSH